MTIKRATLGDEGRRFQILFGTTDSAMMTDIAAVETWLTLVKCDIQTPDGEPLLKAGMPYEAFLAGLTALWQHDAALFWAIHNAVRKANPQWEPVEGVKSHAQGFDLLREGLQRFADGGVIGVFVGPPTLGNPESGWGFSIYDYCDRYEEIKAACEARHRAAVEYLRRVLSGPVRPDFILTGGSGMLVFNTPEIIRDIALPALQDATS